MYQNRHSIGGQEQEGVRLRSECEFVCRRTSWCEAYDWDLNFNACFLHAEVNEQKEATMVIQYVRIRCASPGKRK